MPRYLGNRTFEVPECFLVPQPIGPVKATARILPEQNALELQTSIDPMWDGKAPQYGISAAGIRELKNAFDSLEDE